jgi:hypothetical protein
VNADKSINYNPGGPDGKPYSTGFSVPGLYFGDSIHAPRKSFPSKHGHCTPFLGQGCRQGNQIDWAKVGCFATGFTSSLVDLGPNSPPGPSDTVRTVRAGFEVATPSLKVLLAGSRAADAIPYVGEILLVAQGALAISEGAEAVENCGKR